MFSSFGITLLLATTAFFIIIRNIDYKIKRAKGGLLWQKKDRREKDLTDFGS